MDSFLGSRTNPRDRIGVSPVLLSVLRRDRAVVILGLAAVVTLSWIYLFVMDWGMRHIDVGLQMFIMPTMQNRTAWDLILVFLMWAVMMVAMMVPTVTPTISLFAETSRRRFAVGRRSVFSSAA